jgi:hypothetical protein
METVCHQRRQGMKKRSLVVARLAGIALLGALIVPGCSFLGKIFGVSIESQVARFQDQLNRADRGNVYLRFHPTLTADYEAIKAPEFWEIAFPLVGSEPLSYRITIVSSEWPSDPATLIATISGPEPFGGPRDAKFVMSTDQRDWMIQELYFINADGVSWDPVVR